MPVVLVWRRYHQPLRTMPTVSILSPFQSPQMGMSPVEPKANARSALPVVFELRRYHIPLRKTPAVRVPFPSQSHMIGMSLPPPKTKVLSATPWLSELRSSQTPLRNTPGLAGRISGGVDVGVRVAATICVAVTDGVAVRVTS